MQHWENLAEIELIAFGNVIKIFSRRGCHQRLVVLLKISEKAPVMQFLFIKITVPFYSDFLRKTIFKNQGWI